MGGRIGERGRGGEEGDGGRGCFKQYLDAKGRHSHRSFPVHLPIVRTPASVSECGVRERGRDSEEGA